MIISPFFMGIISTLGAEFIAIVILAIVKRERENKK